ncbi:endonuclease domain-containing protein [Jannaschia sp. R86511]|uniref:endonuclease domain-containing protein n=1 Tax=Jannaschia sp. R86511 TaxID=3093853 RepID=UPI0036D3706F
MLPVHVTTPDRPHRATRRSDLVGHTAQGAVASVRYDGVAVTAPVRTWCDLARSGATRDELVVVGDALLHRWPRLAVPLARSVAAGMGRRGVRGARAALPVLDGRAESPPESLLRLAALDAGLPAPTPQLVVRDGAGRFVARVDLAWEPHRVLVEYDGRHHLEPGQRWRDLLRRERLEALGWRVVVLTAEDFRWGPAAAVTRIRAALHLSCADQAA